MTDILFFGVLLDSKTFIVNSPAQRLPDLSLRSGGWGGDERGSSDPQQSWWVIAEVGERHWRGWCQSWARSHESAGWKATGWAHALVEPQSPREVLSSRCAILCSSCRGMIVLNARLRARLHICDVSLHENGAQGASICKLLKPEFIHVAHMFMESAVSPELKATSQALWTSALSLGLLLAWILIVFPGDTFVMYRICVYSSDSAYSSVCGYCVKAGLRAE